MLNMLDQFKLPVILLFVLIMPILIGGWIPVEVRSLLFAFSLTVKTLLIFFLPFLIFGFVTNTLISFGGKAISFFLILLLAVFSSNMIAIMTGFVIGKFAIPLLNLKLVSAGVASVGSVNSLVVPLQPLWSFNLSPFLSSHQALAAGVITGIILNRMQAEPLSSFFRKYNDVGIWFLKKLFVPIVPFFVAGFAFKLHDDGMLYRAMQNYASVILLILVVHYCYLGVYFFVASGFVWKKWWQNLQAILPATLTGFGTASSVASMPVLIICVEKCVQCKNFVRSVIPLIINIHTIGSAIGITILVLAIVASFNDVSMSWSVFLPFAIYYAIAKFSVVAIPGGVMLVVAPILQSQLGFSDSMVGFMTAMYLLLDPFGTAVNVTGNGCLSLLMSRFIEKFGWDDDVQERADRDQGQHLRQRESDKVICKS